jgi:2'-5' RNA ligase
MSVRYGVVLIPEPSFTARVYRARQLVCGQYGSWAAEMHPLHLTLADYFECAESALDSVSRSLSGIAEEIHNRSLHFPMLSRGVATFPNVAGHIHLDFRVSENPRERRQQELNFLHQQVVSLLEDTPGAVPDLRFAREKFHPHITLMQQAQLTTAVFTGAVEFATSVLRDLQVPNTTRAWQMVLLRFESAAAGEDWNNGRWALDLRWQMLDAYPL